LSYEVLARKWRPRTFEDLVGQSHVVRPLVNALDNQRLHHAFLFTGTRGVGKTTIARILAKSLNCEQGISSRPCGECSTCQEVDAGRYIDLLEVDAASRTKVDDTRELLDNVQYAPTRGRYKVYLIDEVHMLSGHSFNALLKTLEEPPAHVKFLLATTDPQKLPVTILSRCLQFGLKRLEIGQIHQQMEKILQAETIQYESPAVDLLARAADGSMRDGLSLLDQAIAYGNGVLQTDPVREMLGTIDQGIIERLLSALARSDAASLMAAIKDVADHGGDFRSVLDSLALALHHIAMLQADIQLSELSETDRAMLADYAEALSPEAIQLFYQVALHGKRDLPLAPDPRSGLEMSLLRMLAFKPLTLVDVGTPGSGESEISRADRGAPPASVAKPRLNTAAKVTPKTETLPAEIEVQSRVGLETGLAQAMTEECAQAPELFRWPVDCETWARWLDHWSIGGLLGQVLANAVPEAAETEDMAQLVMAVNASHLYSKEREQDLQKLLSERFGKPLRLSIRIGEAKGETPADRQLRINDEAQQAADAAIAADPNIKAMQDIFGARIKPGSVRPRTH